MEGPCLHELVKLCENERNGVNAFSVDSEDPAEFMGVPIWIPDTLSFIVWAGTIIIQEHAEK